MPNVQRGMKMLLAAAVAYYALLSLGAHLLLGPPARPHAPEHVQGRSYQVPRPR